MIKKSWEPLVNKMYLYIYIKFKSGFMGVRWLEVPCSSYPLTAFTDWLSRTFSYFFFTCALESTIGFQLIFDFDLFILYIVVNTNWSRISHENSVKL